MTRQEKHTALYSFSVLIAALLFFAVPVFSQNAKAIARLDNAVIKIGEQTFLRIGVSYRKGTSPIKIIMPEVQDTIVNLVDVLDKGKIDTMLRDTGALVYEQTRSILITSYDSGFYAIPPFTFVVNDDTIESEALLLQVNTVKVDTTKAIADIKAPLAVPEGPEDRSWIMWLCISGGVVILLTLFILWAVRRRKKEIAVTPPPPPIPLHESILRRLEEIRAKNLWQTGQYKLYQSEITDTIRDYIEKRFRVPALEQTTDEILRSFRSLPVDEQSKQRLRQMLLLADMVKFAKEIPLPHENEMSFENAIHFVKGTTPAYLLFGQAPPAQPPVNPYNPYQPPTP
ncbi:MAG: hypothetical protein FD123_2521 [Bacteroidetes bacterium]|nr:MAG: hypothetical protein FD123_2521 [Bacteroidota bacterium]